MEGGKSYKLASRIVDNDTVKPILGRRTRNGPGIIQYIDNDHICQPYTEGVLVFAMDQQCTISQSPLTKEKFQDKFPSVFADKTGRLAGENHRINERIQPVQHVPRMLPVATREKVQRKYTFSPAELSSERGEKEVLADSNQPTAPPSMKSHVSYCAARAGRREKMAAEGTSNTTG